MFEVNFFEKKQRNLLPYLLSAIFLLLLILMGIYFFASYTYYTNAEARNTEWLQTEMDRRAVSRQMQEYDHLTKQLSENKVIFEGKQFPMAQLTETVMAQIPMGEDSISILSLNETNQLTLVLEQLTVVEVADTMEKFQSLPFVSNVDLICVESQDGESGSLVELWLEIDPEILRGEVLP